MRMSEEDYCEMADRVIPDERLIELVHERDGKIVDLEQQLAVYKRSLNTIKGLFTKVQSIVITDG